MREAWIAAKLFLRFMLLAFGLYLAVVCIAKASDLGQWENSDPRVAEWYRSLMRPDMPTASCCGEADAYWADEYHVTAKGNLIVTITDDRPDEPLKRPHIPVGTKFTVPDAKLKWDRGNPTGHSVLFVGNQQYRSEGASLIYCFVQAGGA